MSETTLIVILIAITVLVLLNTYNNYSTNESIELIQAQLDINSEQIAHIKHKQLYFGSKLFSLKAQTIPDELYQSYLTETEETIKVMSELMEEYDRLQSQHNELIEHYTNLANRFGRE